jgi:hypothetical protein
LFIVIIECNEKFRLGSIFSFVVVGFVFVKRLVCCFNYQCVGFGVDGNSTAGYDPAAALGYLWAQLLTGVAFFFFLGIQTCNFV